MKKNKHGLSRDIPAPTKRAVRQACGFGCVICGGSIYQYEHFDPDWINATHHHVSGIALLCGTCHDYVTRGFMQKSDVAEARANPFAFKSGYASMKLKGPSSTKPFTVRIGDCEFFTPRSVIRVFGEDLLILKQAEVAGGPIRVSGRFYGPEAQELLVIEDNEYLVNHSNWDVRTVGGRITINTKQRPVLELDVSEPQNVTIMRMDIRIGDAVIKSNGADVVFEDALSACKLKLSGRIWKAQSALELSHAE